MPNPPDSPRAKFEDSLNRAKKLGEQKHPNADEVQHNAFADSVATLVSGVSVGFFRGSNMRNRLALRKNQHMREDCTFEQAVKACEDICYGPITKEHVSMFYEGLSNDSEEDRRQALQILEETFGKIMY